MVSTETTLAGAMSSVIAEYLVPIDVERVLGELKEGNSDG